MNLRKTTVISALSLGALVLPLMVAGCGFTTMVTPSDALTSAECAELQASVLERERAGDTEGEINAGLDLLIEFCAAEYEIATDYFALKADASSRGPSDCHTWDDFDISAEALQMLRDEGLCNDSGSAPESSSAPAWPDGGLGWNEAGSFVGSAQRVCGPLRGMRNTEWGVFVNVGEDYPSANRFTYVIWGDWWMDPIDSSSTVCATGAISLYEGTLQMELQDPGQLEIWR